MLINYEPNVKATIAFLKLLKVRVNTATVNETLQSHPDWPSLLCISDSLNKWNIPNAAGKIENTAIEQLPLPFIAYTTNRVEPLVIVTKANDGIVSYCSKGNIKEQLQLTYENFFNAWDGTYLIAEPTEHAGEKDFVSNKQKQAVTNVLPLVLFGALLLFLLLSLKKGATPFFETASNNKFAIYLQFGLLTAGVIISSLLLWYEVDKNNPTLKKVCTGIAKGNCDAILSSKQAKIFSWLSWSEVGFFYFTGSLLNLVFTANLSATLLLLSWCSVLVLPYTVFSIYYQWQVAKQWCILCLGIQLLLVLGAAHSFIYYGLHSVATVPVSAYTYLLFLFALPVLTWYIVKPSLLKLQQAKTQKRQYLRLKFNTEIFDTLLKKQKQITLSADGLGIVLGNPHAKYELIKVCNPYCGPCAKSHTEIEHILESNANVKARIIFNATNDEKDYRTEVAKHLLAITEQDDVAITKQALDDWYGATKKDYNIFAKKYPMNGELAKQEDKVKAMDKWCKATDIQFTPTIFIKGHQMPEGYSIKDINYFLLE